MPVLIFNTFSELVGHIASEIGPNGTQDIDGQKHQDILLTTAASLVNILLSIPPDAVAAFPAWDSGELYEGGSETIVSHSGKLWLFVSLTNNTGTTPGTNITVWREISAIELAHFQNTDAYLDLGGGYEVSAQQLFEHINDAALHAANSSWLTTVKSGLNTPPLLPASGDRHRVGTVPTGAWGGHANDIATRVGSGWSFRTSANGDVHKDLEYPGALWMMEGGAWVLLKMGTRLLESITHNVAGARVLDLKKGGFSILVSADIEFDYDSAGSPGGDSEWTVDIHNVSGSTKNITWAVSRWSVKNHLTTLGYPPATIGAGARMSFKFRPYMFGGNMLMTDFTYNVGTL